MLSTILGQPATVRLLSRLLERGRLPHAVLLEGVPGCGRRTVARALAQAVLCAQLREGDACGECDSCRLCQARNHPDLAETPHDTDPTPLSVDLIREQVTDQAFVSPLVGERRVFVLYGIERLRAEAANALLKVFEEPPPTVRFIATTAQAGAVLRTIRSRTQLYRLQPLLVDDLALVLTRGGVAAADARRRAAMADGSHRDCWGDAVTVPLEPLLQLAREGLRSEWVAAVVAQLPTTVSPAGEIAGLTLAGEQRRTLRRWLQVLSQTLRQDLRDPVQAAQTVERLVRLQRLLHDVAVNIQPRLVIEALGLGESERYLQRG